MTMNFISIVLVLVLKETILVESNLGDCDRTTGPAGRFGCIQASRYTGRKQYANCLSDAYIRQKSKDQHQCADSTRDYCWYQCMLEVHNKEYVETTDDCACEDGDQRTQPPTDLPEKCYSPDGSDCSWYGECLEQRHKCSSTPDDYGIVYADKFCRLYDDRMSKFTSEGRRWINAARKCLQVALVPTIRQYYKGDCKSIKQTAFDSHTQCYLKPGFGAPSICDLDSSDWMSSLWTIKGAVISRESYKTLGEMVTVVSSCANNMVTSGIKSLGLILSKTFSRRKRQVDEDFTNLKWDIAAKAAETVSKRLDWIDNPSMDFFTYIEDSSNQSFSNLTVIFWLRNTNDNSSVIELEGEKFENLVASGDQLSLNIDGHSFAASGLNTCDDALCETISKYTPIGEPKIQGGKSGVWIAIGVIGGVVLLVVIVVVLYKRRQPRLRSRIL